jgi:hypothetical protein
MQAQRPGDLQYPQSTLLKSSIDLGWSSLSAELYNHRDYEGPGVAASPDAEVSVVVRGSDKGLLTYKFAGSWQSARLTTGSIRLRPIGPTCDEVHVSANVEALHLYLPTSTFARLADNSLPPAPGRFIRYSGGVQDELINQIGLSVLSDWRMLDPLSFRVLSGRFLVLRSRLRSRPHIRPSRPGRFDVCFVPIADSSAS